MAYTRLETLNNAFLEAIKGLPNNFLNYELIKRIILDYWINAADTLVYDALEVMPDIFRGHEYIQESIYSYWISFTYADHDDSKWFLEKPFIFFGKAYLQVLTLVFYAGPLDLIEKYIRLYPELLLYRFNYHGVIKGTLLELAIIFSELPIIDKENNLIDESLVGKIIKLHVELFPDSLPEVLKKIKSALSETESEKLLREKKNTSALNELFDAFDSDNNRINRQIAIKKFEKFVENTVPIKDISNNIYYLNLLHIYYSILDVAAKRSDGHLMKRWNFMFASIEALDRFKLPIRIQQLIYGDLEILFNARKKPSREWDFFSPSLDTMYLVKRIRRNRKEFYLNCHSNDFFRIHQEKIEVIRKNADLLFQLLSSFYISIKKLVSLSEIKSENKTSDAISIESKYSAKFFVSIFNSHFIPLEKNFEEIYVDKTIPALLNYYCLNQKKFSDNEKSNISERWCSDIAKYLCQVVVQDKVSLAESILEMSPNLLFFELEEKESIRDHAGRIIYGSAYQIALATGSCRMLKMMDLIIYRISGYPTALKQYENQFSVKKSKDRDESKGDSKPCLELKEQFSRFNFDSLVSAITQNPTESEETKRELALFKNYFNVKDKVFRLGKHFDVKYLSDAIEIYINNSDVWEKKHKAFFAIHVIGYLQKQLPSCEFLDFILFHKYQNFISYIFKPCEDLDLNFIFDEALKIKQFTEFELGLLGKTCYITMNNQIENGNERKTDKFREKPFSSNWCRFLENKIAFLNNNLESIVSKAEEEKLQYRKL